MKGKTARPIWNFLLRRRVRSWVDSRVCHALRSGNLGSGSMAAKPVLPGFRFTQFLIHFSQFGTTMLESLERLPRFDSRLPSILSSLLHIMSHNDFCHSIVRMELLRPSNIQCFDGRKCITLVIQLVPRLVRPQWLVTYLMTIWDRVYYIISSPPSGLSFNPIEEVLYSKFRSSQVCDR